LQGGYTTLVSFTASTNQISTGGYSYDAAGNMTNDGFHSYSYDAEGSVIAVDGGQTAQYSYNALNQRVQVTVPSGIYQYVLNPAGKPLRFGMGPQTPGLRDSITGAGVGNPWRT